MFNTINESVSWKYEIYGSNQDEIFTEHFYLIFCRMIDSKLYK